MKQQEWLDLGRQTGCAVLLEEPLCRHTSFQIGGQAEALITAPDAAALQSIIDMLRPSYIKGLTLLGGEPFEPRNQADVVKLLRRIKTELPEKTIWAFSGFLFEQDMLSGRIGDVSEYLSYLDVLVDGPFVMAKKNLNLRFRGSENQRIIDMKASLAAGETILWDDDQKGMREHGAYSR